MIREVGRVREEKVEVEEKIVGGGESRVKLVRCLLQRGNPRVDSSGVDRLCYTLDTVG